MSNAPATLYQQVIQQANMMDEILTGQMALRQMLEVDVNDGDHIGTVLLQSFTVQENQQSTQTVTFNLSEDSDFLVDSLSIFPYIRKVSLNTAVSGPSDNTFRPAKMSSSPMLTVNDLSFVVSGSFEMFDSSGWRYSNEPVNLASLFTGQLYTRGSIGSKIPQTIQPGRLAFDVPKRILRGQTVSVQVTVDYAGPSVGASAGLRINEYQMRVCLLGRKTAFGIR